MDKGCGKKLEVPVAQCGLENFTNSTEKFKELILGVQRALKSYGTDLKAFSGLKYFNVLSDYEKEDVLKNLELYNIIIKNMTSIDEEMQDDLRFIWSAIKTYNIVPPEQFLTPYRKGTVFEIYDKTGRQVFRNFEFFNYVSYSLEQIFCVPWYQLYWRDEKYTDQIFSLAFDLYSRRESVMVLNPVESHEVEEIDSDFGNLVNLKITAAVPFFSRVREQEYAGVFSEIKFIRSTKTPISEPSHTMVERKFGPVSKLSLVKN